MKTLFLSLLIVTGCCARSQIIITKEDFKPAEGKWEGTLTYLDYTSNNPQIIKAGTAIEFVNDSTFDQVLYYADEPGKSTKSRYVIKENGTMLSDMKVIERTRQADGLLKIVLESKGPDGNGNQPATFHQVMLISATRFIIIKMVKFDGEDKFFQRHQYSFSR